MKWVTNWSNATAIVDPKPEGYAKDITLRYPILSVFDGTKIRITLNNGTGNEVVHFEKITIAKTINDQDIDIDTIQTITFSNQTKIDLQPGHSIVSDEIELICKKQESFSISIYLSDYTSMRAAVMTMGPLTKGYYALQDQSEEAILPRDRSKEISWFYFLSDVEIYTEDQNRSILCFGDSITAQAWPEYLQLKLMDKQISIVRKAVSGSRVLKEYSCTMYEMFGYKSATRFPTETNISGCDTILVLQGVNDLVHPVGIENNIFRPMSDLPSSQELIEGYRNMIQIAREKNVRILFGTILPIKGYKSYTQQKEEIRKEVNHWIRTTNEIDGYIDFDAYIQDPKDPCAMLPIFDSGDHLHPSDKGHKHLADVAYDTLRKYEIL